MMKIVLSFDFYFFLKKRYPPVYPNFYMLFYKNSWQNQTKFGKKTYLCGVFEGLKIKKILQWQL